MQKPKAELSGSPGGLFDLIIQKRHREEMNLNSLPVWILLCYNIRQDTGE